MLYLWWNTLLDFSCTYVCCQLGGSVVSRDDVRCSIVFGCYRSVCVSVLNADVIGKGKNCSGQDLWRCFIEAASHLFTLRILTYGQRDEARSREPILPLPMHHKKTPPPTRTPHQHTAPPPPPSTPQHNPRLMHCIPQQRCHRLILSSQPLHSSVYASV